MLKLQQPFIARFQPLLAVAHSAPWVAERTMDFTFRVFTLVVH